MTDFDTSLLFEKAHDVESAKQMYYTSMKKLQVDYIDYYLLHGIGGGGMQKTWAHSCQDCEECLSKCPQQIRIPNQMARIVETLRK